MEFAEEIKKHRVNETRTLIARGLKKHCKGRGCPLNQGGKCRVGKPCPLALAGHRLAMIKGNPSACQINDAFALKAQVDTAMDAEMEGEV